MSIKQIVTSGGRYDATTETANTDNPVEAAALARHFGLVAKLSPLGKG